MSSEDKDFEYFEVEEVEQTFAGEAATEEPTGEDPSSADETEGPAETSVADEVPSEGDAFAEDAVAEDAPADDDEASDSEEEEEFYEIEFSEDDIVAYLEDEDGNEIGIVVLEESEEVEYYYADEDGAEFEPVEGSSDSSKTRSGGKEDLDLGITSESVAETTENMNDIFKESVAVGKELKDAITDITGSFRDLTGIDAETAKNFLKRTKRRR